MPEPTRLSISINESQKKKTEIRRLFTLDFLKSWIRKQNYDEYTTAGLIALASKYPAAALPSFVKNINLMIHRVRAQRQLDQEGESHGKEKRENPKQTSPKSKPVLDNQVFAKGPEKVSITEDELRDEWEGEVRQETEIDQPAQEKIVEE